MYCKSGRVETASKILNRMKDENIKSWSAMVAGYGMHGRGGEVLELLISGVKPNHISFVSVLTSRSLSGIANDQRHIALGSCPKIKSEERRQLALDSGWKIDGDATDPPRRHYRSTLNSLSDQDVSYENHAMMIIVHEYPLQMVEQPTVVAFAQSLQRRFRMPSLNAIDGEIFKVYQKEKPNLMQLFGTLPGRISRISKLFYKAQCLCYDISTTITTMKKHDEALEERSVAALAQSAEFGWLATEAMPKDFHCMCVRLTEEWFEDTSLGKLADE